ncbi:Small G-protein Ras2 [Balamuthia mandrillaris]
MKTQPPGTSNMKLCILGDGGVGKTALTIQLVSQTFIEEYDPTIEDSYRKQVRVGDETYMLEILDTAGQEEFSALRDQWIRECEGFLIVYDITSRISFDELPKFHKQILRVKDTERANNIMIVGNKCDLAEHREVSVTEGEDLAKSYGSLFLEASAKTRTNVEECFYQLVTEIKKIREGASDSHGGGQGGGKDGAGGKKKGSGGGGGKRRGGPCSLF